MNDRVEWFTTGPSGPEISRTRVTTVSGRALRIDHFGRVNLDSCPDERSHILAPAAQGEERRSCSLLIDEGMFPVVPKGKKGTWTISVTFKEEDQ